MSEKPSSLQDGSETLRGASHLSAPRRSVFGGISDVEDQMRRLRL